MLDHQGLLGMEFSVLSMLDPTAVLNERDGEKPQLVELLARLLSRIS